MNPIEKSNVLLLGNEHAEGTIVFVHGFGTEQGVWRRILPAFTDTYRLVLLDLVGASEKTVASYSPDVYSSYHVFADDLVAVADALKLHSAVLVGHSMGAMISLLAALKHPTAFGTLAMIAASPYYLNDGEYCGGFSESEIEALLAQVETNFYGWVSGFAPIATGTSAEDSVAQHFAQGLLQMRPDVALAVLKTVFRSDHRTDVARLSIPTLALQARNDTIVPESVGYFLQQTMPQCKLEFLNTTGHLPHLVAPEEITHHLLAFVSRFFHRAHTA